MEKQYTYDTARQVVLRECQMALSKVEPEQVEALVDAIDAAGQVFFTGVGRVFLTLECVAKRMAHLGVRAHVVGEVVEPPIAAGDLLIVGSGSGESLCPVALAKKGKSLGAKIAWIGSNEESTLAAFADVRVRVPVRSKLAKSDELPSDQPMTTLFEQSLLLLGDAIALMWMRRKGIAGDLYLKHANLE